MKKHANWSMFHQVKATGRSMREEMSKLKERTEELKKQKVKERGKVHRLLAFKEDGEECKVLMTEMSLRRESEEVVKMQDRLQMNPNTVILCGKLSGKEKRQGKQDRKMLEEADRREWKEHKKND